MTGETDGTETAYNDARTARQTAKSKTSIQDEQEVGLDWTLQQLANYVEKVSDGDKAKIESAGFSVRNEPTPIGQLPPPTDLQAAASDHPGSADLSWQLDRDARLFLIERAEDAEELTFRQIATATKKSASVNSMVSGKKYWFRVAAAGPVGQSPWSDPVPLFAP
ncbi:MAG: fibronectin type III domain-containing protein [Verrucomicrobiota bacterium]